MAQTSAANSVDFVPFLNEISQFIKESENRQEHVAFLAFQKMFRAFAKGEVEGEAKRAFRAVLKKHKKEEIDDGETSDGYSCLLEWPQLTTLPSFHLRRHVPDEYCREITRRTELEDQTPYIINDGKSGELRRVDFFESARNQLAKIPRQKEIQTEEIQFPDACVLA